MSKKLLGVTGKLLRVDLNQEKAWTEDIPASFSKSGIGGKALGIKLLSEEKNGSDDPLDPSSKIVLSTGLLTGTGAPTGAWMSLLALSPLTGFLTASSAGGEFPAKLKLAGYDAVVIEGKAKQPTSLVLGEEIYFHPASSLWNKTVQETDAYFASHWGRGVRVLAIGPAGERQYKTATIVIDRSRNGISPGLGAVMGSKNLKAIAVYGEKALPVADPSGLLKASSHMLDRIAQKFIMFRNLSSYGTSYFLPLLNQDGVLPTENFRSGFFEKSGKVDSEAIRDSLRPVKIACFSCPIACRKLSHMEGKWVEGPDLHDLVSFGTLCGNENLQSILRARHQCNELGIDPLSMGSAICSSMDLQEQGILSEGDVGFSLRFGDSSAIRQLFDQVAKDEGFGRILAEDPLQVARTHSSLNTMFHVRGQPVGLYHPLHDSQMDLHYRLSNSGSWFLLSATAFAKDLEIYDEFQARDEVSRVRLYQDVMAALESLGLCEYLLLFLNLSDISSLVAPVLGFDLQPQALLQLGQRVFDAERLLNLAWNGNQNLSSAKPSWPSKVKNEALAQYFSLRHWDKKGKPKNKVAL